MINYVIERSRQKHLRGGERKQDEEFNVKEKGGIINQHFKVQVAE
jgi:hypothetical protein